MILWICAGNIAEENNNKTDEGRIELYFIALLFVHSFWFGLVWLRVEIIPFALVWRWLLSLSSLDSGFCHAGQMTGVCSHIAAFFPNSLAKASGSLTRTSIYIFPPWAMSSPFMWLILCVNLSVSTRLFHNEINIWIGRLSGADCSPSCGWASANPGEAWIEQKAE